MSKKEELAREYSFNIPSEIYNTLETDADRLLWKSETERAFEAGWDAGKQEIEHIVWQVATANYEKGKKEIIDKACEWLEDNLLSYWQQCVTDPEEFIKEFHKAMGEE